MSQRLTLFAALAVAAATALTASAQTSTPAETITSLQTALAQRVDDLGACNVERGQLERVSALVMAGKLVPPEQVQASDRTSFEKANPGKTLDSTWKVIDKPKDEKKSGGGR